MANLHIVGDDIVATRAAFEGASKQLGRVPNLFRVIGNSPPQATGIAGPVGGARPRRAADGTA
jgi:hypothetical protein